MIEAQADVHHRPDADQVAIWRFDHYRSLDDRFHRHDPDLGRVDDRLGDDRARPPGVVEREGTALDVLEAKLLGARSIGQIADLAVETVDAEAVRILDHRHD